MPWSILYRLIQYENGESQPFFFSDVWLRTLIHFGNQPSIFSMPGRENDSRELPVEIEPSVWMKYPVVIDFFAAVVSRKQYPWDGDQISQFYKSAIRLIRGGIFPRLRREIAAHILMYNLCESVSKMDGYSDLQKALRGNDFMKLGDVEVYRCLTLRNEDKLWRSLKACLAQHDLIWYLSDPLDIRDTGTNFVVFSLSGKQHLIEFTPFLTSTRVQIKRLDSYFRTGIYLDRTKSAMSAPPVTGKRPIDGPSGVFPGKPKKKARAERSAPDLTESFYLAEITDLKAKIVDLKKSVFENQQEVDRLEQVNVQQDQESVRIENNCKIAQAKLEKAETTIKQLEQIETKHRLEIVGLNHKL